MDLATDSILFQAVQQNDDRKAFDKLYLMYWEKMFSIAWHRTGDEDLTKDIIQDLFISIWQRRAEIVIHTTFGQYLAGALKYRLISYYQSEKVKHTVFEKVFRRMTEISNTMDDLSMYKELEEALGAELEEMSENMKNSFLMRLDNFSIKEIAARLNLAEQTVNNNLTEAGKRLRKNLAHRFNNGQLGMLVCIIELIASSR
ncbi:RNA polymerase sigma factor [Pedobacter sp. AW31-3R]|uniref:RNA polymerase sigma factor n=1 Tax=Pedobacter sp. AW31-3R TaxID=3445781 RepID=UPI003FA1859E